MSRSYLLCKETLDNFITFKDDFNALPLLKMPTGNKPISGHSQNPGILNFFIKPELCDAIKVLAKAEETTPETIYLAALKALLHRYTSQDDIFLTQLYLPQQTGPKAEPVFSAIRTRFEGNIPFNDLLKGLNETRSGEAERINFSGLQQFLKNAHATVEVFQTLFMFGLPNDHASTEVLDRTIKLFTDFRLGLSIKETTGGADIQVYHNQNKFDKELATAFAQQYIILLKGIVEKPGKSVGSYRILTDQEWQNIVVDFNNTIVPYPKHKTLFQLFEERAAVAPDNIALRKGDKTLTYAQLNARANQLAHYLIVKGIVPADNIGLLVTRDVDMIIGMLGILKAGGAYVPIDPDYPIDRQEYIFNQSSLKLVVADNNYPLKSMLDEEAFLKIDAKTLKGFSDTNPNVNISSSQLAYTIYTSGSTGRPKGVMIEHHSAVNLVLWVNKQYNVGADDSLLFITSMCFDLSVYDIFGMLAAGGSIVIAEQSEIQDVKRLQRMLIEYKITFWDSVPTTMDYLIKNLELTEPKYSYKGLKTVFMSGDWIPVDLPERIKRFMPETQVISLGGATEGTVWSNFFPVVETNKNWPSIPYGKPLDNNFFYILNEQLQPVPYGVVGDFYIGGAGVSLGYAGEPEKTAAAFIKDPFNNQLGGIMYRTGDLGKIWPDLNMEFIGRKDNQVKIQGFRIELGEIESVLNSYELIDSGVVLARDDNEGKKRLVGYIVPKGTVNIEVLSSYLKTKLPQYMVPAVWISLEQLPLTANGKIDRKSLPDVDEVISAKPVVQPSTLTEKILKAIWLECMELKELSVTDNFFDLGGHSLMAVQILTQLEDQTGVKLQLAVLFKYPDIRSLAEFVDSKSNIGPKVEERFKCLIPIKPTGSKPPIYLVHGEGLNVLNFGKMAALLDDDQPVFGLQALGLDSKDEPLNDMSAIAANYLDEILRHDPKGPYILGGYSFGGYVAVEMQRQMEAMGKRIELLIMLDTDGEQPEPKPAYKIFLRKIPRNIAKLIAKMRTALFGVPNDHAYKTTDELLNNRSDRFLKQIENIQARHIEAFAKYRISPFNAKIHLFRARTSVHYADDMVLYGWDKFAQKGVEVFHVPGDHRSMFETPHVAALAKSLQDLLNRVPKS